MYKSLKVTLLSLAVYSKIAAGDAQIQPVPTQGVMESAKNVFDNYICHPVFAYFIQNSAESMPLEKLANLLQKKINSCMDTFMDLGKEAKEMQRNGSDLKALRAKHAQMADVFYSMRTVEPMVRNMYPKLNKLFDQLIALRENLDYSIVDTDILVKDPEDRTILEKIMGK